MKTMNEINVGDWYYMMLGYGGSESKYCYITAKTEEKTGANMFSLFSREGGMKPLPVSEVFIAIDERGCEHKVSANDLESNGHIGIGTLSKPRVPPVCSIWREDAELLVAMGKLSKAEIEAEFPFAFRPYEEVEAHISTQEPKPMTANQIAILKAAYRANEEKKQKEKEEEAEKFAKAVEEARKRYSYIPCPRADNGWLKTGEISRNLRAVLKHEFAATKFSVSTSSYSGGSSATVEWTDGPTKKSVEAIVGGFETCKPDTSGDYWDDIQTVISTVCGGFSHVFAGRRMSEGVEKYLRTFFERTWPRKDGEPDWNYNQRIHNECYEVFSRTEFPKEFEIVGIEFNDEECRFELKIEDKGAKAKPESVQCKGAEVRENTEQNGIEIKFDSIPSAEVREALKAAGFRWSKFNKVWYHRATEKNRAKAMEIVAMIEGAAA